jgi:branched-chain amino acid transport system permease protein/urea transport system permease protein
MDPLVLTQAINVLYGVSTLAALTLGLAVIFGLLGVLNIAHGEFIMIGAYCAYVAQADGWPYLAAVPLTLVICGVLGYVVERVLIRPLYRRPFDTLVATWGLSLLLREIAKAIFGLGYRSLAIPLPGTVQFLGTDYPTYRLVLIAISIAIVVGLVVWYGRSRTGAWIRAMIGNPELAQAQGISVTKLASATFIIGTCLAGLGGVMVAPLVPVEPYMGLDYVLRAFFVLVVGGLGSALGLFTGAAVIGGVDSVASAVINATYGYFTVLVLAILVLWLKPRGIIAQG